MSIRCLFLGHKWTKWKYIKPIGRYEHKLIRACKRCGKVDTYIGLTERDIETDEHLPYIHKN